jgi:hypothetical protein
MAASVKIKVFWDVGLFTASVIRVMSEAVNTSETSVNVYQRTRPSDSSSFI